MRRRSPQSSSQVPRDLVEVLVEGASFPALDLREPVEDRAHVESHPERHLHDALLVHGLELSDRHRHAVRLDQGPRIADRDEALAVRRELPERLVRPIAERPEIHPEPLPRAWMQSGIIDIPVQETLLLRLRGFRGASISEGVVRQPVLTAGHELLVRQGVAECVKLAVFRDPHEKMPAFFAHLDESLHHRELLREFRQRAVDRNDAPFEVVCEVDGRLAFDQSAVFVHHVPRLLLPPLFREFKEGPVELILGGDELLNVETPTMRCTSRQSFRRKPWPSNAYRKSPTEIRASHQLERLSRKEYDPSTAIMSFAGSAQWKVRKSGISSGGSGTSR